MLRGTFTALVTPFGEDGALDEKALSKLVDLQLEAGIDGLVLLGTTGEEAALSLDEKRRILELVAERVDERVPLVAGAFSNVTRDAVSLAKELDRLEVQAILSVVPYYTKPNQEGIYEHFLRIADAIDHPLLLSNVPARTARALHPETVLQLAEHDNVLGIDDSSEDFDLLSILLAEAPEDFGIFAGEDSLALPMLALGCHGVFSLVANEAPALMSRLVSETLDADLTQARRLHQRLFPLMQANTIDVNPIPVKAALAMMGLIEEHYRLPMTPLGPEDRAELRAELIRLDLLG